MSIGLQYELNLELCAWIQIGAMQIANDARNFVMLYAF